MILRLFTRDKQQLLFYLIVIVITFVYRFPDVYAYFTTPMGMVFLGQNSWFDPHDANVYTSAIHYAQLGHLSLPNLWTALPNKPIIIFPIEMLLGFTFRSVNPYLLFWLSSIICGVMLIYGIYWLIHKIVGLPYILAAMTTLGIALGGGFGFFISSSSDITNSITFYEAFFKPHGAIAMLCYLYALVMFYEIIIHSKRFIVKETIFLSLSLIISLLIYPYFIVTYLIITLLSLIIFKVTISKIQLVVIYAPAMLTVGFVAWQLLSNQGFFQPLTQHLPTKFIPTVLGYGILLPIFCYQLSFMQKTKLIRYLSLWILITLTLAFLPFGPGKIFLRGLFFPLVLLVILQLKTFIDLINIGIVRILCWGAFLALLCTTNIYIMFLRNYVAHTPDAVNIIYMSKEEFKIFAYLKNHTPHNSGVLAGELITNLIPAYTYNRGAIGSMGSITDVYTQQLMTMKSFYAGQPKTKNYLKENNISYILWGPEEKKITNNFFYRRDIKDLRELYKNIRLVYETKTVKLYKVE